MKKHGPTLFLRAAVTLIGMAVLMVCAFVLPIGIASDNVGGYRLILLGLYVTAVPFFAALYETMKLLDYIDTHQAFSPLSVAALKRITYYAAAICVMYTVSMPYIYTTAQIDDAPGVVALGLIIIFASAVITVFGAVLQKLLQQAIKIKSENDLTV